jgi:hypothetical protein
MTTANINRFIQYLHEAFVALEASVPMARVEQLAVLVHRAMESPRRRYHVSDHALYMCEGMAARQVLAGVFHDVVYYQLDGGFAPHLSTLLTPIVSHQGHELVLLKPGPDDAGLQLCLDLFGFQPGQVLPLFGGMNEFLSAAVAVRLLQDHLGLADLLAVVACIEATVPFRPPDPDGLDCSMRLGARVRAQAHKLLGLDQGEALEAYVTAVMRDAVAVANRDLGSFAEPEPGLFISGTWLLIEESNAPLAAVGVYTLDDYRQALSRMQTFLDGLVAARIFHRYAGVPGEHAFGRMTLTAAANVGFASVFLRLKILSISLVLALALETGGNGPVSMFLGDIRSSHGRPQRIEDHLPPGPNPPGLDARILDLLEIGRPQDSRSDLTVSPLTAYIYRCLGPEGSARALQQAQRMQAGALAPRAFLATLPADVLGSIIDACAQIAVSRRARLQMLKAELLSGRI